MDVRETTQLIKALRTEGKLDEALQLARPLHGACPTDRWVVGALGWTLYYYIKKEREAGNLDKAKELAIELQNMKVSAETDDILFKQTESILKSLSPEFAEMAAAKELSKNGQHAAAAKLLRETVSKFPGSVEAKTSLGWELYRLLHVETDLKRSIELLRDYCRLKLNTKPDRLHSLLLSEACKRAEKWTDFGKFIEWWKTDNLTSEDWQESFGKDGAGPFPSLAAKLATALYKNAKIFHKRGSCHQWMLPFIRKVVETTDSDWTYYYLARLSVWFEADLTGVKDLIVPLVKAKQGEFWAWQALADCTTDTAEKMAFYARAVLSATAEEDYKVDLLHQYALFLAQTEQHQTASFVARRHIAIQVKKEKQPSSDILQMKQAAWFDTHTKDDLNDRLQPAAEEAARFLFKDHPWTSANFIEVLDGQEGRPPLTVLLLADKGYSKVKKRCAPSDRPERGAPIRVKLFWPPISTKPQKPGEPAPAPPLGVIYDWEPRQDGTPYDCAKQYCGVVSQINTEKQFVRIALSVKRFGLLHFVTSPREYDLAIGDMVVIWSNDLSTHREDLVPILHFQKTPQRSVTGLYRQFEGLIDIRNGNPFGFVRDDTDIFVPPNLVSSHSLTDHHAVKGWALCEWNMKKNQPGWSALIIEPYFSA
jgi:hypothetical protein